MGANLAALRAELLRGDVAVGAYRYFMVRDPKPRCICAASFRERVLHHAIMNVCEAEFERVAIHDSYACRSGKGTHAAVRRARYFASRHAYCVKLDIRKYFDSIDHAALMDLLERRFKDSAVLRLFARIVASYETAPGKGLPIGNLTSQHFANHYLGALDHHVKETLGVRGYLRYMDDFLLWTDSRGEARRLLHEVRAFLREELRLELKPPQLRPAVAGLDFLGFRVHPDHVGLSRRSRRRVHDKLHRAWTRHQRGVWSEAELAQHVLPVLGFTKVAACRHFRQRLFRQLGMQP